MRHGSEKEEFETGAKRDTSEGKGRPSLISPVLIHRLGVLLEEGAKHYDVDNWVKGIPFRRTADSMIRHLFQWLAGDEEEDHLAAVAFGVMCLMHYEELAVHKDLSFSDIPFRKLDDRCVELKKILPSILTTPKHNATLKSKGAEGCPRCGGGGVEEKSKAIKYDPTKEQIIPCPDCGRPFAKLITESHGASCKMRKCLRCYRGMKDEGNSLCKECLDAAEYAQQAE